MNVGLGLGGDLGGVAPLADLVQDVADIQLGVGGSGGLGLLDSGGEVGHASTLGNAGDLAV